MFEVRNVPILVDEIDILKELRLQVFNKTGRQILNKIKRSGSNIMICCPIHKHGQEKNPSCGITTISHGTTPSGTVHCMACGYVDSLQGMIAKCFGYEDPHYGETWLMDNFVDNEDYRRPSLISENLRKQIRHPIEEPVSFITEEELSTYRFTHSYMYRRKLTDEVIEKYDIGYQKDYIAVQDLKTGYERKEEVITFPVRDINGNCLFVSRRSIKGKNFYLPLDIQKPVYGIYELPKGCRQVYICESVINALTCVVYGKPAVALFGTGTPYQYNILKRLPVRKYILALDPDDSGEKGCKRIKTALKDKLLSKLIIPKGKDINDLSYEEFINLPQTTLF